MSPFDWLTSPSLVKLQFQYKKERQDGLQSGDVPTKTGFGARGVPVYTKTGFGARGVPVYTKTGFGAGGMPVYTKTGFGARGVPVHTKTGFGARGTPVYTKTSFGASGRLYSFQDMLGTRYEFLTMRKEINDRKWYRNSSNLEKSDFFVTIF